MAQLDATAPPGPSASGAGESAGTRERPLGSGSRSAPASQAPGAGGSRGSSSSPTSPAPSSAALGSLNDRLQALNTGGDVDYTSKRLKIGDAQAVIDRALAAYEAGLAPSPDILRRTFGFIYERRSARQPDSIAYVFDTYSLGPITMCKAWKIVEHPDQPIHEVGPVAGSAGDRRRGDDQRQFGSRPARQRRTRRSIDRSVSVHFKILYGGADGLDYDPAAAASRSAPVSRPDRARPLRRKTKHRIIADGCPEKRADEARFSVIRERGKRAVFV